jgi:tRNA1Val (adenine37-N6)-methyltransferase
MLFLEFNSTHFVLKPIRDFRFKQFTISRDGATHKVGTDGVLLGAWVNVDKAKSILDIGTGSGVIAIMLAQRNADAVIDAIEIQHEDAVQAKINAEQSRWKERIHVHEVAVQNYSSSICYDLIVSNPPFFVNSWLPPTEKRAKVRHAQSLSFEDLLESVLRLLSPQGKFGLILPYQEALAFIALAESRNLFCNRMCDFKTRAHKKVERVLMEFGFERDVLIKEEVLLYEEGDVWSEGYVNLTGEFYL